MITAPFHGAYKAGAAPAPGTPFITGQTTGSPRNNFDGCVGFKFTVGGSSITVTDLGRWKISGNSQTHTVKIVATDGTVIVSASIDVSGGTDGTYVYASVSPTVLSASTAYVLLSEEFNGGDQWYDNNCTIDSTTGVATTDGAHFQSGCAGAPGFALGGASTYGIPNFMHQ